MEARMDGDMNEFEAWMSGSLYGWKPGWMEICLDESMDGWR